MGGMAQCEYCFEYSSPGGTIFHDNDCPAIHPTAMVFDKGYECGYKDATYAISGLLGMAQAIRETHCYVCKECGFTDYYEKCYCWNDE